MSYRVDPADEDDAWRRWLEALTQIGGRVLIEAPTLGKVIEMREEYVADAPAAVYPPPPSPLPAGPRRRRSGTACRPRSCPR